MRSETVKHTRAPCARHAGTIRAEDEPVLPAHQLRIALERKVVDGYDARARRSEAVRAYCV